MHVTDRVALICLKSWQIFGLHQTSSILCDLQLICEIDLDMGGSVVQCFAQSLYNKKIFEGWRAETYFDWIKMLLMRLMVFISFKY